MVSVAKVGHSYDGAKWTVNDLVKAPARVPNIVRDFVKDADISQWLLRPGPTAVGGAVVFEENLVQYANDDAEIVAEFGEIPMTNSPMRTQITRATVKRGLGLKISEEMRTRNDVGRVADEIRMVKNKIVRGKDRIFFNAIMAADVNLVAASNVTGGWVSGANTGIIKDIASAMYAIANQAPAGAAENEKLGYEADTLIIHPSYEYLLIDNAEIAAIFAGSPLASESLRYTGKMPKKFMNLDVLKSWSVPLTTAVVCQRKAMGFISDEWPLTGSPMKFDESTDSYHTYFRYRNLVAIDNPKAVAFIQGVDA
jgi:hypothetical protein